MYGNKIDDHFRVRTLGWLGFKMFGTVRSETKSYKTYEHVFKFVYHAKTKYRNRHSTSFSVIDGYVNINGLFVSSIRVQYASSTVMG